MKYLPLIGGPAHGRSVAVAEDCWKVVYEDQPRTRIGDDRPPARACSYTTYTRRQLQFEQGSLISVLVPEAWTTYEAVSLLLHGGHAATLATDLIEFADHIADWTGENVSPDWLREEAEKFIARKTQVNGK